MSTITIYDLEEIKDNYKIEIINTKVSEVLYRITINSDVTINGYILSYKINLSREHIEDIKAMNMLTDEYINNIIKLEALNYYINNPKIIRKRKLEIIEKNNECR